MEVDVKTLVFITRLSCNRDGGYIKFYSIYMNVLVDGPIHWLVTKQFPEWENKFSCFSNFPFFQKDTNKSH